MLNFVATLKIAGGLTNKLYKISLSSEVMKNIHEASGNSEIGTAAVLLVLIFHSAICPYKCVVAYIWCWYRSFL